MYHDFSQQLLSGYKADTSLMMQHIEGSADSIATRFSVYQNNVFHSLLENLKRIYPITNALIGNEDFSALAVQYIHAYPPSSPVMAEYGESFSNYLADQPFLVLEHYVSQIAWLEFKLTQLTQKAESSYLSSQEISRHLAELDDPMHSYWRLIPDTLLVKSPIALGDIYLSQIANQPFPSSIESDSYLLLAKQGLFGHCWKLDKSCWQLIKALKGGARLDEACQSIPDTDFESLFAQLVTLPIFMRIEHA